MTSTRSQKPFCQVERPIRVDDGTLCRLPSLTPRVHGGEEETPWSRVLPPWEQWTLFSLFPPRLSTYQGGNYCGPSWGGSSNAGLNSATSNLRLPFDAIDESCRDHDQCYSERGYFDRACDRALIERLTKLAIDPQALGQQRRDAQIMANWFEFQSFVTVSAGGAARSVTTLGTWDSFQRARYVADTARLSRDALAFVVDGSMLEPEAAKWAVERRNNTLLMTRGRSSPLGNTLATLAKERPLALEELLAKKGTFRAVIESASRTNRVFNGAAAVVRVAGPTLLVLDFGSAAAVTAQAPDGKKAETAVREFVPRLCGIAGGLTGGLFAVAPPVALVISVAGSSAASWACTVAVEKLYLTK